MVAAGEALSGFDIDDILANTDNLLGEMRKVSDLVKLQQKNYADLAIKLAISNQNLEMERRKIRVLSGSFEIAAYLLFYCFLYIFLH